MRRVVLILAALIAFAGPAAAVTPDEMLDDPALEKRARDLSAELRCLVCQNQSIDDSNADLARDLRVLVRERLKAGDTDEQVIDYLVSRYGEFVLLKPRLSTRTIILWSTPVVILLIGGVAVAMNMRSRSRQTRATPTLSVAEEERLSEILRERD